MAWIQSGADSTTGRHSFRPESPRERARIASSDESVEITEDFDEEADETVWDISLPALLWSLMEAGSAAWVSPVWNAAAGEWQFVVLTTAEFSIALNNAFNAHVLVKATDSVLGHVTQGARITITDGVISADAQVAADGSITAVKLADGAVTTAKIPDLGVTWAKIAGAPTNYHSPYWDGSNWAFALLTAAADHTALAAIVTALSGTVSTHAAMKASAGTLGHIRIGAGLSIDSDGIVSADAGTSYSGGAGLTLSGTVFDVNVDAATIEISSDVLRVKDGGVSAVKLADGSVTTVKLADASVTAAKLAPASAAYASPVWDGVGWYYAVLTAASDHTALASTVSTLSGTVSSHTGAIASDTVLGHVKQGNGVLIDGGGVLSIKTEFSALALGPGGLSLATGGVQEGHYANTSITDAKLKADIKLGSLALVTIPGVGSFQDAVNFLHSSVIALDNNRVNGRLDIDLHHRLFAASSAATNNGSLDLVAVDDPKYRRMVNLGGLVYVRLQGMFAGSVAAGTKMRIQYHVGGNVNVSSGDAGWTTLVESAGSHAVNSWFYTSQANVPLGAQINNCLIRICIYGGDAVADPAISGCYLNFYAT